MTSPLPPLEISYRRIEELRPYARNARKHSKQQIRQIADSIAAFGFTNPVLIDEAGSIIAGHGRVAAAKLVKIAEVPTVLLSGLSEDQIRAYIIADNKLAERAEWDDAILKIEFQHLLSLESDFNINLTGFEVGEIDLLMKCEPQGPESDGSECWDREAVTKEGDIWCLGKHRILCASCLHDHSFEKLMNGKMASAVFTDPPYNVAIDGNVCGNGSIRHDEFKMASGEMTAQQFEAFLHGSLTRLSRFSTPESVHFVCMDWRHLGELLAAGQRVYDTFLNLCVWVKDNGGMGSLYRSRHELVLVFRNGKVKHRNNVQLGRFGRNRTNVWEFPGISTMSKQSSEGNLLALHPTVKPVSLVAEAILDCTAPKQIVLDSFLGSGTTLLAAERVGRVCYGMELDPRYVEVAIRRWQSITGLRATDAKSGQTFDSRESEGGTNA